MYATNDEEISYCDREFAAFKRRLTLGLTVGGVGAIWAVSIVAVRIERLIDGLPDDQPGPMTVMQASAGIAGLAFFLTVSYAATLLAWRHSGPRSWLASMQRRSRR